MPRSLLERLTSSPAVRAKAHRVERWIARAVAAAVPPHVMRNKRLFDVWERRGYHVTPVHFYEPIPDTRTLAVADLDHPSELVGIDLDVLTQLELARDF